MGGGVTALHWAPASGEGGGGGGSRSGGEGGEEVVAVGTEEGVISLFSAAAAGVAHWEEKLSIAGICMCKS
jgi:hypothetical protein